MLLVTRPSVRWLTLAFALGFATFSSGPAGASAQAADDRPAAVDSPEAHALLQRMATFLAAQKAFRVTVDCAHDTVQPSGQKIEFLDRRTLTLKRPDSLRMDVEAGDGDRSLVVMNPATITAQKLSENVYAQAEAKPTLEESLRFFIRDLRMRMPLALLLVGTLPDELGKRVVQADVVGDSTVLGRPAVQVAGSTGSVDFQVWIADGDRPLPLRIVLTYRDADGEPQFRANFSDWDLSPWTWKSTFEPKIGKDARRIAFLTQVRLAAPVADDAGVSR